MDNCLKDTLIQRIRTHLSPKTQVLKFSNPPKLIKEPEEFQKIHFQDMFDLIELTLSHGSRNLILNRAHLGEYVYSPIYRGYDGSWIFDMEESFLNNTEKYGDKIRLFLLYDSDNEQLGYREDGKSFSKLNNKRLDFERKRFKLAFEECKIPKKFKFDLSNYTQKNHQLAGEIDVDSILNQMLDL